MSFAIDTFPKERLGLVTGSKCSVLFPEKGDGKKGQITYAKQLAKEKFFGFHDEMSTWETRHGDMGQGEAFTFYNENINSEIQEAGFFIKGDCGGSPDGICKNYGVEIKCPTSLGKWLDYLTEPPSKDQYHQCQMYIYLTGKKYWELCPYLIETEFMTSNGFVYPIPKEKRMLRIRIDKDPKWAKALKLATPFVIHERNKYIETYKQQFNGIPS